MGWKNIKEHYRIGHAVQVTKQGICIGSPFIHNIIVIGSDGSIVKRPSSTRNADLDRYLSEIEADPGKVKELLQSPDTFTASIPVYTYKGGSIIEKQCEELGWPNVTHDGDMMYDNTFSADKAKVVKWAKENARYAIESWERRIKEIRDDLAKVELDLSETKANLAKLQAEYP